MRLGAKKKKKKKKLGDRNTVQLIRVYMVIRHILICVVRAMFNML